MKKIYIKVLAEFRTDGIIVPQAIIWEDGSVYQIDRVRDVRRAVSLKAGGMGFRYEIQTGGKWKYIWLEERNPDEIGGAKWFVEGK